MVVAVVGVLVAVVVALVVMVVVVNAVVVVSMTDVEVHVVLMVVVVAEVVVVMCAVVVVVVDVLGVGAWRTLHANVCGVHRRCITANCAPLATLGDHQSEDGKVAGIVKSCTDTALEMMGGPRTPRGCPQQEVALHSFMRLAGQGSSQHLIDLVTREHKECELPVRASGPQRQVNNAHLPQIDYRAGRGPQLLGI